LFNLCPIAGSSLGYVHTEEAKEKMKYIRPISTRLKISESLKVRDKIGFPTGVFLNKSSTKYCSKIEYKSKIYHIGTFTTVEEASSAYKIFAGDPEKGVECYEAKKQGRLDKKFSVFPGVCFHSRDKTWVAQVKRKGKYIFQKSFKTEQEAHEARCNFLESLNK
jgi:hypothetical protein